MRGFYGYRRYLPKKLILRMILTLAGLLLIVLSIVGIMRMKAMLTRLATSRVTNAVNQIVSDAVNEAIDRGTFQYDRMISFEKDNDGKITAVKSNMPELNRLQSAILDEVLSRIDQVSTRDLSIPLGSLTRSNLLAGRGPLVTVRMQSIGSSEADLRNEFTSAGINQTKHQVILDIDVYVSILLPGFQTATKVSNSVIVAETIIVGSVPSTYTYFQSNDSMEQTAKDHILNGN
jgi:sporulation protein YunB